MSSARTGIATVSALAKQAIQPCTCVRAFSSSARRSATVLKAEKLDKGHDPLDMNLLEEFGHDDLPARAHRIIEHDREKLHLLRLVQFQLPEIKSKMRRPYKPPPSSNVVKVQTIYHPAEPDHPASRKAVIMVHAHAIQTGTGYLDKPLARRKFRILAGSRFDPTTDSVKISCDRFPTLSMNQKWCSDALDRLVQESEDLTDNLQDFPEARETPQGQRRLRPKRAGLEHMPKEWLQGIEITQTMSSDLVDAKADEEAAAKRLEKQKKAQPKGKAMKQL